jgi:hypothetical protein
MFCFLFGHISVFWLAFFCRSSARISCYIHHSHTWCGYFPTHYSTWFGGPAGNGTGKPQRFIQPLSPLLALGNLMDVFGQCWDDMLHQQSASAPSNVFINRNSSYLDDDQANKTTKYRYRRPSPFQALFPFQIDYLLSTEKPPVSIFSLAYVHLAQRSFVSREIDNRVGSNTISTSDLKVGYQGQNPNIKGPVAMIEKLECCIWICTKGEPRTMHDLNLRKKTLGKTPIHQSLSSYAGYIMDDINPWNAATQGDPKLMQCLILTWNSTVLDNVESYLETY